VNLLKRGSAPEEHRDSVRALARKRLGKVSSVEVLTWAESAVNGFHVYLDAYRGKADPADLDELRKAVSMLAGAVDVLESRKPS
jgi:hypothetical protein